MALCQVLLHLPVQPSNSHPLLIPADPPSTADEIPDGGTTFSTKIDLHDPRDAAPYASVKVSYRPRGGSLCLFCNLAHSLPELLMAQGVIVGHGVDAGISGGSEANDRKRAREDESSGPSKKRTRPTVKKEEHSADTRAQRIQALQVSRVN
jgi:hypothetical protein